MSGLDVVRYWVTIPRVVLFSVEFGNPDVSGLELFLFRRNVDRTINHFIAHLKPEENRDSNLSRNTVEI